MEIQSFTIRHISNQVLSNTLTPDVARLIIGFLPLKHNQTINGKKEGVWKGWRENGQLKYEECYKDGKEDGVCKCWHDNGKLSYEGCYKDGKKNGIMKWWYDNGQIKHKVCYKDGKMDGVHKGWFRCGQLSYEDCYKDGKRNEDCITRQRCLLNYTCSH